ncbi:hypothetical protein EJG51_011895 [Undibacterium piscinae]|uniref:Uncharacterized protein n=1 Tax=Undibacterium piscinae TaxID=2495591 RepID=A0A6M4A335_9BURK|nr:hypothetical protein EJG51_011895 [Undibacterium piscinae]
MAVNLRTSKTWAYRSSLPDPGRQYRQRCFRNEDEYQWYLIRQSGKNAGAAKWAMVWRAFNTLNMQEAMNSPQKMALGYKTPRSDPANLASAKVLFKGLLRERWIVGGVKSDSAMYGLPSGENLKLAVARMTA